MRLIETDKASRWGRTRRRRGLLSGWRRTQVGISKCQGHEVAVVTALSEEQGQWGPRRVCRARAGVRSDFSRRLWLRGPGLEGWGTGAREGLWQRLGERCGARGWMGLLFRGVAETSEEAQSLGWTEVASGQRGPFAEMGGTRQGSPARARSRCFHVSLSFDFPGTGYKCPVSFTTASPVHVTYEAVFLVPTLQTRKPRLWRLHPESQEAEQSQARTRGPASPTPGTVNCQPQGHNQQWGHFGLSQLKQCCWLLVSRSQGGC